MTKIVELESLNLLQKQALYHLWNQEYPARISFNQIQHFDSYLADLAEVHHVLVLDHEEKIKGWYFDFVRKKELWFALILSSSVHGKGIGSELLERAKQKHLVMNGWVIDHDHDLKRNGETYKSPLPFYRKNDFEVLHNQRLESEAISAVKVRWRMKALEE